MAEYGAVNRLLRFTQLPNRKTSVIPGTGRRAVYTPQTVKNSALCLGNMYAVGNGIAPGVGH